VRLLWLIPVIIAVSFIVFALMELAPGTLIDAILSEEMTPEVREELIREHNLDRSMFYRYWRYMINLVQGDLGVSEQTGLSVWNEFITRLPNTLILAFTSIIIGTAISIPLGIIAAKRARTLLDNAVTLFSLVGMSMPVFWLGLLLLLAFSFHLRWLPSGAFDHGIRSLILPAVCSSMILVANTTRQTRSNMLEVLKADYLRTARAKGVPEQVVIRRHALGNAWIPIVTAIGTNLGSQLGGSVVVESVFAWPGIGRLAAEAVRARDVTTVTGVVIMTTILFVLILLSVDLLYANIDPRIKAQYVSNSKKKRAKRAAEKERQVPTEVFAMRQGVSHNAPSDENEAREQPNAASLRGEHVTADVQIANEKATEVSVESESVRVVATNRTPTKSFATRDRIECGTEGISYLQATSQDCDDGESAVIKHKKRSQLGDIMHSLKRNKGAMAGFVILSIMVLLFFISLFISWESVTAMNAHNRFALPSWRHPFGTDNFGRDMFLRTIYGTRYTLAIGFGVVAFGSIFGITLGSFAGFYGGKVDDIIMRVADTVASLPGLLLGMVIVTVLGQSLQNLIIAVGVQAAPIYLRMTRASVLTVRNQEYVEAARAIGCSNIRILFTQVLPNGWAAIIVTLTASLGISIITAASLSFLGFGVPVPQPEWGALISTASEFARHAPHLMLFPGIFIMLTVLAFNLLGDGIRDALDPKMKGR